MFYQITLDTDFKSFTYKSFSFIRQPKIIEMYLKVVKVTIPI